MPVTKNVLLVLLSSVLFALALPNEIYLFGNPFVGWLALAPLYLALKSASSPRQASGYGAIFGFVSTVLSNFWLMFFGDYSVWTIGGTALGYTAYNFVLGAFLWMVLQTKSAYRPALFALMWTGYEYLKSVGFLGYPWGLSAYPFNGIIPLIQITDVFGVWALCFLAVYVNAILAEVLTNPRLIRSFSTPLRHGVFAVLLIAVTLGYGVVRMNSEIPVRDHVRMLLVQQNVDTWNTSDIEGALYQIQSVTSEAIEETEGEIDVVVWSETSLRFYYSTNRGWFSRNPTQQPFLTFLSTLPAPLLTGAPHTEHDGEEYFNAAILLDQEGQLSTWYGKQQLVPFAESIPFYDYEVVRTFFAEVIGLPSTWSAGPGYELFTLTTENNNTVSVGTPICFEDGFAQVTAGFVRNGADLLVNLTNNAWSRTNSAQVQHFVAARFRAIESRRTLVRSTNAGYTTVVNPWGEEIDSLPMFETDTLLVDVPVYVTEHPTRYLLWGDFLPISIFIFFVLLGVNYLVWDKKRAPKVPQGATSRTVQ